MSHFIIDSFKNSFKICNIIQRTPIFVLLFDRKNWNMSNQTVQFKDFVFLSLDPLKVAGWSTNKYNHLIFSKLFDMVCLALNYLFVKKIEKALVH